MTTSIAAGDWTNLRSRYHRSSFYLSVLKPLTLWTGNVTSSAARGTTAITWNSGSGLDFSAVEAPQVVWIGTAAGDKDLAVLRIRSVSSGDGGVTGTVNVAWHGYQFGPGAFLTFVHDYPIAAKYPWLGQSGVLGTNEVFYKDVFDTYSNQTQANQIKPVPVIDFSHRAGFVVGGDLTFWVDASNSYAMAPGATISSYALSVYPTTGVTVTFNTATGIGRVRVTSLTQSYYWLKFTVTDSNANSRVAYRCVFAHNPDPSGSNYPIVNFEVNQYSDDWESGGITTQIRMNRQLSEVFSGDRDAVDMIDTAFTILWKETVMGDQFFNVSRVPTVRSADHLFVDPAIEVTSITTSATCDIDTEFHAGVRINNAVPADASTIGLHVQVNSETPIAVTGTVTAGIVNATRTVNALLGACSGGTLKWLYSGVVIASVTINTSKLISDSSIYPSTFLAHPQHLCVGYLRESTIDQDTEKGAGIHTYALESGDAILKNNYMFSIPIDARSSPTEWHHFHSQMTTASAAMFVMDFHSNVFQVLDVVGLNGDTRLRPYGEFTGSSLWDMVDGIVQNEGIRAHFKFNRDGQMHLVSDVQLLDNTPRNALPTVSTVEKQDRGGELSITERPEPNVALVYGSGIYWDGSFDSDGTVGDGQVGAYCCLAPWYIPHWGGGASTTNFERQTVDSQAHLNALTGRVYARLNNQFPRFSFAWSGDYLWALNLHFEEFWTINVAAADNVKGLVFASQKIILRNIEADIEVSTGTITVNTSWETEVQSLDAVTAICPEIDISLPGLPPIDWREEAAAMVTGGSVYYLPPFDSQWDLRTSETVLDIVDDPFWEIKQSSSDPLDSILVRCGVGYIKRSTDGGVSWTTVTPGTNPPNDAGDSPAPTVGAVTFAQISASVVTQDEFLFIARWQNASSVWRSWLLHTDDDFSSFTWKAISSPGNTIASTGSDTIIESDLWTIVGNMGNVKSTAILSETKFVMIQQEATNFDLEAIVCDISGDTITPGSPQVIHTPAPNEVSEFKCVGLSSTHFIVVYKEVGGPIYARAGEVTGTIISFGIQATVEATNAQYVAIDALNSTNAAVLYTWSSGSSHEVRCRIAQISGTSITTGNATAVDAGSLDHDTELAVAALDSNNFVGLFQRSAGSPRPGRVFAANVAGTTITAGTPVLFHAAATVDYTMVRSLTTSKFVVGYRDSVPAPDNIYAIVGDVSGTTITLGTEQLVRASVANSGCAIDAIDSTRFIIGYWDSTALKETFRICTVSGTSISLGTEYAVTGVTNRAANQVYVLSATKALFAHHELNNEDHNAYTINFAGSLESRALSVVIGKGLGLLAYVIYWDGSDIQCIKYNVPALTAANYYNLGSATSAQINNKTYIAWATAVPGNDGNIFVFGRMNNPFGLGTVHILEMVLSGNSWLTFEDTWGANHCGALYVELDSRVMAVRNLASSSQLYRQEGVSLVFKSNVLFANTVQPRGMIVDELDGTVIACSAGSGSIMVAISASPYIDWLDITANHGTGSGINSVVLL